MWRAIFSTTISSEFRTSWKKSVLIDRRKWREVSAGSGLGTSPGFLRRDLQKFADVPQEKLIHMQNENSRSQTEARKEAPRAPSASYSITMRVRIDNKVGMIGEVISAIGRAGGDVGAIDIVQATGAHVIRDITADAASVEHSQEIVDHIGELPGVEVINVSDRTFLLH